MLNEQELIAYLENSLLPADRERIEAELERDPQLRRQLFQHAQMEQALRAALGGANSNERVKQSVLTVVRGEQEETLKQRVMADTTDSSDRRRHEESLTSPFLKFGSWASEIMRLLTSSPTGTVTFALAACLCIFIGVWFATHQDSKRLAPLALAIETPVRVQLASGMVIPKPGDTIRVDGAGSGTITFADGTILHLEPGTEIVFQPVANANPPRPGGKQFKLISGSLSADVAMQPPGLPLLIQTPHALVTVVGTEFDLDVVTNQTALEVTHGLVKMTGSSETNPVSVAAGEFAVASPKRATQSGHLARHPYLWPFSSASVWNRPLGSGAKFLPVPGKSFLADGPLENAMRSRRPFLGSPSDPLRRIWVNGEARTDVRLAEKNLPGTNLNGSLVLLQQGRRYALELSGVTVRADGDLDVRAVARTDLAGSGADEFASDAKPFGLSNLGGLLRAGELENGIRHALSARVNRERLAGRSFPNPLTVWPAAGNAAGGESEIHLRIGTLLAIPPAVDIKKIAGDSGPAYELARALQDYGVYVTGTIAAPFVLLADEAGAGKADELITQLVPHLQVVTNNSPETAGGGGTPRRDPAPALPGESK